MKGTMKTKRNRIAKAAGRDCKQRHGKKSVTRSAKRLAPAFVSSKPTVVVVEAAAVAPPAPQVEAHAYTGDSAFHLYVREIGQTKLLTPQEEVQLAKRIQKGDDDAREHMIKANLRLVVKIAREYEDFGLPLLDLINEGNIGLMRAVERFDPTKGAKLSTYASWWIKQSIKRALSNQSKSIRLPIHVVQELARMRK